MMNSNEDPSWDQDIISRGDVLRRSLQNVLSGSGCDQAQAHAASIDTAQWTIRKMEDISNALPASLMDIYPRRLTLHQEPMGNWCRYGMR